MMIVVSDIGWLATGLGSAVLAGCVLGLVLGLLRSL